MKCGWLVRFMWKVSALGETEDEMWVIKCQVFQGLALNFQPAEDISKWAAMKVSWEKLVLCGGWVPSGEQISTGWAFAEGKKKPVHRERSWFCGLNVTLVPRRCRFKTNFYCRLSEEVWACCLPKLPVCNTGRIILPITPFLSYWDHIPSWEGNIYQLVVT